MLRCIAWELGTHLDLLLHRCSKLAPDYCHVFAVDLRIGYAGNIHQPAAVKTEGRHVLQQEEGIYCIHGSNKSLQSK